MNGYRLPAEAMNRFWLNAVIFSCLFVVTSALNRALMRNSEPPMEKTHPRFWGREDRNRNIFLQSKNVWYLQIESNGKVSSSKRQTESAVITLVSGINRTVALKGKKADMFLCMNNQSRVYASTEPNETDCFFVETYQPNQYNTYHHSFHRRGDMKNYLSIADDGTVTVGSLSDKDKVHFLPIDSKRKTHFVTTTTTTATTYYPVTTSAPRTVSPTTSSVPSIKRKLEKTRKRRRRWCKFLIAGKLEKNPEKYSERCKYDCSILKTMIDNPKRYKRKCEKQRQRRRRRNRKKYIQKHGHRRRHENSRKRNRKDRHRSRNRRRPSVRSSDSDTYKSDVT